MLTWKKGSASHPRSALASPISTSFNVPELVLARSAERVRQRGDSFPTKFVFNKTREKQRRMSESVYLIRERGSGEPRVLPSWLIERPSRSALIEQKKSPRRRALVGAYDAQLRFEDLACGDGELLRIHAARIFLDALIHQMRNGRDLTEFSLMLRQAGKDDRIGIVGKQRYPGPLC